MESNWAAENLQVIRTLMERSAVYRRALAPVMTVAGAVGLVAGTAAWWLGWEEPKSFAAYWLAVAAVSTIFALVQIRRQALKEGENFWSPPTRRVALAAFPCLLIGALLGIYFLMHGTSREAVAALVILWLLFYGCALNAAGVFIPRGIRWVGWLFILAGLLIALIMAWGAVTISSRQWHLVMGATFGGLHLAYGVYLYFTEKRKNAA